MTAKLVQKIEFYKNVLIVLYILTAISIVSSLSFSLIYIVQKKEQFKELSVLSSELTQSIQAQDIQGSMEKAKSYKSKMEVLESSAFNLNLEMILSVLCIIIFGVIVPILIIKKIKGQIESLHKEMETQVQKWVQTWIHELKSHGANAYQNPDFWLKIGLLVVEQTAIYTSHPAVYIAAELSRIIRLELDKAKTALQSC